MNIHHLSPDVLRLFYQTVNPDFDCLAVLKLMRVAKVSAGANTSPVVLSVPLSPETARPILLTLIQLCIKNQLVPPARSALLTALRQFDRMS
ncbi:MAG: hypothetical protein D6768_13115 [Chloroflexi bacterium]|nr:MAG: hypothetical protein D6768_13115 [Chloroflexota bacterium]